MIALSSILPAWWRRAQSRDGLRDSSGSQQAAVEFIGPGMIGAADHGLDVAGSAQQLVGAVLAHVEETADAALPLVADTIKGDVLQFQPGQTNTLTVAGAPALHLIGSGVEADDGDPSTADVVVFAVGGHAFVACVHGEHNDASREREPMLTTLQTAKQPE